MPVRSDHKHPCSPAGADRGFLLLGRLRDDLSQLYLDRYGKNHYSVAITKRPAQVPFVGGVLVAPEVISATAMHADIFVPQRIAEQVMIGHKSFIKQNSTGGIAVMLDARQTEETDRVVRRLARLAPHLSSALELSLATKGLDAAAATNHALLAEVSGAVFLLDPALRMLDINSAGEALLRQGDGVRSEQGRLTASLRTERRGFAEALAYAARPLDTMREHQRLTFRLKRRGGWPLLVSVTPVPRAALEPWAEVTRGTCLLVQIVDPLAEAPSAVARALREIFELTPAEARVAALIGEGMSAPQAAAALSVSVNTVRTHLMRCFDKIAIHSQVVLARLIAQLPV